MTNAIVAGCIIVLLISLVTAIIRLQLMGQNTLFGTPPIPIMIMITGKISITITIFTALLDALGLDIGWEVPSWLQWLAVLLLLVGMGFAVPSLFQLGEELRFGLSEEHTHTLKSRGLYHISRNPLYLGFYLIGIAACLYAPYWTSIFFVALAVIIHHQIVLAEEKFLHSQFGETYDNYARQVHRYL